MRGGSKLIFVKIVNFSRDFLYVLRDDCSIVLCNFELAYSGWSTPFVLIKEESRWSISFKTEFFSDEIYILFLLIFMKCRELCA